MKYKKQLTVIGSAIESASVLLRNMIAKRADLILAVTSYYKELLKKMNIDPKRIYTINHGVDFSRISSTKVNGNVSFDACFMGNLIPRKGIFDLVRVWRKVVDEKPNAKLVMIGAGSQNTIEQLNSLICKFDLSKNIIRTGWLDDEKFQVMKKSKIFVFPSYGEGFALAVCEAMACGLPVVAYDLSAYKNIYRNGMTKVKTGSVQELAKAIIWLLEDETARKQSGKKAIEQAKEYDWNEAARTQLEIITKFLQTTK